MQLPSNKVTPPPHILVVEDDVDLCQLNAAVLLGAGYKVDTAADGQAAWAALKIWRYDLVLTDNKMPRMTGIELLGELRIAGMLLPVILASGTTDPGETSLKPAAILPKPYTAETLLATVKEVLDVTTGSGHLRLEQGNKN